MQRLSIPGISTGIHQRAVAKRSWNGEEKQERGEEKLDWVFLIIIIIIPFCWVFLHTDLRYDFHITSLVSRHQQPSEGNNFLLSSFVTVVEE